MHKPGNVINKPGPVILSKAPALSLEAKNLPRPRKEQKTMNDPGRRAQRDPSLARCAPADSGSSGRCAMGT